MVLITHPGNVKEETSKIFQMVVFRQTLHTLHRKASRKACLTFPAYQFTECCEMFPSYLQILPAAGVTVPHTDEHCDRTLCATKVTNDQVSSFRVFQLLRFNIDPY